LPHYLIDAFWNTMRRMRRLPARRGCYFHRIAAFIQLHDSRHAREMAAPEATAILVQRQISASPQNQSFCALLFLHHSGLALEMPAPEGLPRARRREHLPAVISLCFATALLERLELTGARWPARPERAERRHRA
jgi:hypothetical protein